MYLSQFAVVLVGKPLVMRSGRRLTDRAVGELSSWKARCDVPACIMTTAMNHDNRDKQRLIRRLRCLWTFELFDSFFFPGLVIFVSRTQQLSVGLFTLHSTGLVTWLLWQGAAYWWLRLRAVRRDSRIDAKHLRWFATLKKANWALIGLLPLLLLGRGLVGSAFRSPLDVAAGIGLYALAILEQINYYHRQLMYDYPPDRRYLVRNRRLKRSSLSRALDTLKEK